jgi:hypothetical protein
MREVHAQYRIFFYQRRQIVNKSYAIFISLYNHGQYHTRLVLNELLRLSIAVSYKHSSVYLFTDYVRNGQADKVLIFI